MAGPLRGYRRLPGSRHRYRTPSGKDISEYEYRSRKASRAGFRNYADQRRFRESRDFQALRFDALSEDSDTDLSPGSDLERAANSIRARGGPVGSGADVNMDEEEAVQLLRAIGVPDYYFWRFWYGEA